MYDSVIADLSTSTATSTSVAVNDVQSAALEPPSAKRSRTDQSSPDVITE